MKNLAVTIILHALLMAIMTVANSGPVAAQTRKSGIDKGDFKAGFSKATLKKYPGKKMDKDSAAIMQELAAILNEMIALPYDMYLHFDTCGVPNAFYDPNTKEITMCYEFISEFERVFRQVADTPEMASEMTFGATMVIFFHELGHGLIDVWDLPATGRQEDAVDQLAVLLLLDGKPEGEMMVLSAATYFSAVSAEQGNSKPIFWGLHSLDQQRFYDMVCLTYGSNPQKNKDLLGNDFLPRARAQTCPADYKQINRAWERLLAPYLKN